MSEVRATPEGVLVMARVFVPKGIDERGYVMAKGDPDLISSIVSRCRGNEMIVLDLKYDTQRTGAKTLRIKGSLVQAVE